MDMVSLVLVSLGSCLLWGLLRLDDLGTSLRKSALTLLLAALVSGGQARLGSRPGRGWS